MDEIAARIRTTKRMIYYYFRDKEALFTAVPERAHTVIRSVEQQADVDHLDPVPAIRRLTGLTFDHHEARRSTCSAGSSGRAARRASSPPTSMRSTCTPWSVVPAPSATDGGPDRHIAGPGPRPAALQLGGRGRSAG